ncbi:MAG: RNA 2',3'-cyclic phosphodiesterase [Candidatus Doudnabacteria bacterium]|nr:RNA 2',3'-cyclic phosphodiesterase [Candidatus Doudnabacteria bacterium]
MRLFTAIPLPEETKQTVGELTRGRLPVPYINTSNLHITLNFFGDLSDPEVDKVRKIFDQTAKGFEKFSIEFDALVKSGDQIHLTLQPNDKLNTIQLVLEKAFLGGGFKFSDREYYPHVKLTNLHMDKVMNPERKLDDFPQEELKKLNFRAENIILYESKLLLHHPKHIPLIEFNLV